MVTLGGDAGVAVASAGGLVTASVGGLVTASVAGLVTVSDGGLVMPAGVVACVGAGSGLDGVKVGRPPF